MRQVNPCIKKPHSASYGYAGTAAAAGEAATEAAADTVRATLDPADGGREALHVAARKCGSMSSPLDKLPGGLSKVLSAVGLVCAVACTPHGAPC